MPRPVKCRRICCMPVADCFAPVPSGNCGGDSGNVVFITVEEFEAIRQIDYLGLNQEDCAVRMCVARTTLQRIYSEARVKLAKALVEGIPLRIQGGNFELCDSEENVCRCGKCHK